MRIVLVLASFVLLVPPAAAQHQPFQDYFLSVCGGAPSGSLTTRCNETPGGAGDLSTDSELSLNPNQVLATHDAARGRARQLSQDLEERMAARRGENEDAAVASPVGLILNGRFTRVDRDRSFIASSSQPQPLQEERGYETNEGSIQLGGDVRVSDSIIVGGLFSYFRADSDFDADRSSDPTFSPSSKSGTSEVDSYFFTLFGTVDLGDGLYADGSFGGGVTRQELRRSVVFQETTRTVAQTNVVAESSPDGFEIATTLGLGYDHRVGALSVGPYLRGRYIRTHVDRFSERDVTGSGLAMRVEEETQHSATTVLGARASYALSTSFGVVVPQIRVEWEHEYANRALTTNQSLLLDTSSNVYAQRGAKPDRDFANLGAGVTTVLPGGLMLFAEYEGIFGYQDLSRHRVTGGVRFELR